MNNHACTPRRLNSDPAHSTRRSFIKHTGAVAGLALAPNIIVRAADTQPPSQRLNIAGVGVGGMGKNNLKKCASENIVALCDVDQDYSAKVFQEYPGAKVYRDYREMLEKQKDIDAVIVATPDHTHAPIALAAIRAGKHVYVQKPLTYTVREARMLTEAAREHKVVTQMGNQGHSGDGTRSLCEWIRAGLIGEVREVDAWTNRPVWPQGIEMERPSETPPVPAGLDWDLWLGPAPYRPYNPAYLPATWRGWCDFGTGSLGDMGCHIIDVAFWALKLKYPTAVEANISTFWHGFFKKTEPRNELFPRSNIVRFQFPARGGMPPVKLTWWDGGMMPARPDGVGPDDSLGDEDGGVIFRGSKGVLICGCYGRSPRLYPASLRAEAAAIPRTIERIPGSMEGHEMDWVRACKGGPPASSNFDYSGPLTETVLMGNLAVRFPNQQLLWDGVNTVFTNHKEANEFVHRKYREGWTL